MPFSLTKELASMKKDNHGWFGVDFDPTTTTRTRKRNPPQPIITPTITTHKKTRIAQNPKKKRLFFYDSDPEELTPTPSLKRMRRCSSQRDKIELQKVLAKGGGDDDLVDMDYIQFLKMVTEYSDGSLEDNVDCGGGGFESSVEEEIVDPDYKIFLENAREDGNSYVFDMKKDDGTRVLLRYERDDKEKEIELEEEEEESGEDVEVDEDIQVDEDNDDVLSQENREGCDIEMDRGVEKRNECVGQNSGDIPGEAYWFLSRCKPGTISKADESYLKFLDHLWVKGDSLIYKNGDVTVKYDEDNGGVTDSEELGGNVMSNGKKRKFTPNTDLKTKEMTMNVDDSDSDDLNYEDSSSDDSDSVEILDERTVRAEYKDRFAKQLKQVLQKPFDAKEFEVLQIDSKIRKPMDRSRETRRRISSYATDILGKSYLDLHDDLKKMLKVAVPERALALLRCLFFYYENVSHQGAFVPWIKPPAWLHDLICPFPENRKCPMKCHSFHEGMHRL